MRTTFELIKADPARHPLTGDNKIAQEIACIHPARFSAGTIRLHLAHIRELYTERPPEVVAPLAQHLLSALLQMDTVKSAAIEEVLQVIKERGLWVEPAESAGGRAPGIEPAETFEEFVARNQLTAERLAERARKASRAEAAPMAEQGQIGNGRSRADNYQGYESRAGHGTSSDYLLAKLARDCPEYLQRWKAGEFASVRAACLAAGIIKVQPQLVLTKDPFTSAQRIQEQRGQDWVDDLIGALSPGGISSGERAGEVRLFLEGLEPERLRHVLSSLCSRRPHVFEQLLDDMQDEGEPQQTPAAVELTAPIQLEWPQPAPPQPAPEPAPVSSNGPDKASKLQRIPEPGLYGASQLARAAGVSSRAITDAARTREDGDEVLTRTLADTPVMAVVRKANPQSERYEVLPR
jgi:hypothetical protein